MLTISPALNCYFRFGWDLRISSIPVLLCDLGLVGSSKEKVVTLVLKDNIKLQEERGHMNLFFSLFCFSSKHRCRRALQESEPHFGNTQLLLEIEGD